MTTAALRDDPLGYDAFLRSDIDPTGRAATGVELVENAILHRLQADTLLMIGAPGGEIDYGVDVRKWVGGAMTPDAIAAKGVRLAIVLQRDPRIDATSLRVEVVRSAAKFADGSKVSFAINITARTVTGIVIDRIVGVSAVTVAFLAAGK